MSSDSAYTSRNQIPSLMKKGLLHGVNLDIGGGKYDKATEYLATQGVKNFVMDPYNRSEEHNDWAFGQTIRAECNSITCLNVLNVIPNENERLQVVANIASLVHQHYLMTGKCPSVYFQIYNGKCKKVNADIQVRMPMSFYEPMLRSAFHHLKWEAHKQGNCMWFTPIY